MYLHSCASEDTLDNAVLRDVKRLAVVEKEPRAMVLHAVVLSRQGRDEDALALLRPALQNICPSLTIPSVDRDALLTNCLPIPWEVYAHSAKAVGDHKGAAEVQRIAAVEYQSPNAMMEYARDLLEEQDDFDQYESFMCRAATSSHSEASFSLANFYYLAYLDLHPITLERISVKEKTPESKTDRVVAAEARVAKERRMMKDSAKRETFLNQVVSFARSAFDTSRSRDEMRQLAMNWYDFAYECGNFKAALLLARIQHQKGQTEKAIELLSAAERDRSLLNPVRKLRFAWENGTTEPKIPDRWLHI